MLKNEFHINDINDLEDKNLQSIIQKIKKITVSPDFFPYRIDFDSNKIYFVIMNHKNYKKSFFILSPGEGPGYLQSAYSISLNLSDVISIFKSCNYLNKSVILYNHGFCCSTLLCRLLEESFSLLSLKEPPALHDLKSFLQNNTNDDLKHAIFSLHNRSYKSSQNILWKPSDYAFDLITETNSKSIPSLYLYSPLREYIASCSKGKRVDWIKNRFIAANPDKIIKYLGPLSENKDLSKTSVQASLYWCYFAKKFNDFSLNGNIVALNSRTLLKKPNIVYKLGNHFNLKRRFNIFERKNINKLLNTYVKTDAYDFNASDREKMLSEIINSNIDEILEAEKMVGDILDTDMKDFVFEKEID